MKARNIKIIVLLLIASVFISCQNVLDREPQDAITDLNFWSTTEDLELFCNNFYPSLYTPDVEADVQSDDAVPNSQNDWLFNNVTVPESGGGWAIEDWENIRNTNYYLTHYQEVEGDESLIQQYTGEIHFFRAYEYFEKVKRFGDVPWINKDLNIDDEEFLFKERTPRNEVIDSILSDLQYATNHLKLPSELEEGRIHKFAALQLMARVALYEGSWMKYRDESGWESYLQTAVDAADQIMNEGGYDIVKAQVDYYFREGDLIDQKTDTYSDKDYPLYYKGQFIQEDLTSNEEAVLSKSFELDVLTHGISRRINESGIGISKDFIESFLSVDGLPIALSSLYEGDDSAVTEFKNRDPRLRNMIDNRFLPNDVNNNVINSNYLTALNSNVPTGYMQSKYRNPLREQNEANQSTFDLYVFRYAEVLLIYAEAKAELENINQSDLDKTINKLRARLDSPDLPNGKMGRLTMTPPTDPNSITITGEPRYGYEIPPLIYEIRRERRIELAFEGFRWDDIVRWNAGKLIENPKTIYGITTNKNIEKDYNDYFDSDIFSNVQTVKISDWDGEKELVAPYGNVTRKWDDRLYLHPIPKEEISLSNGSLEQNPGW